jgi:hypothetical protein
MFIAVDSLYSTKYSLFSNIAHYSYMTISSHHFSFGVHCLTLHLIWRTYYTIENT